MPVAQTLAKVDPAIYDGLVGEYQLGPGFTIVITRDANRLLAQATGQAKFEIFPESETRFFAKVTPLTIVFVKGADGKVTRLEATQGEKTQPGRKVR